MVGDVSTIPEDGSGSRRQQAGQTLGQRALAAPRLSHNAQGAASRNGYADITDGVYPALGMANGHILKSQQGCIHMVTLC
jgi:hypothetical protein